MSLVQDMYAQLAIFALDANRDKMEEKAFKTKLLNMINKIIIT